jgi:hypothetical protein
MSSELNIETMNYNILPPEPPQIEVLNIINPDSIITNDIFEGIEPPVLPKKEAVEYQSENLFVKGEFLYIEDSYSRKMLVNAWNAITQLELWNYMKQEQDSYMWSKDNEISSIYSKMEELGYTGHSGGSFGWTMRQMQYIAQNGEDKYVQDVVSQYKYITRNETNNI